MERGHNERERILCETSVLCKKIESDKSKQFKRNNMTNIPLLRNFI